MVYEIHRNHEKHENHENCEFCVAWKSVLLDVKLVRKPMEFREYRECENHENCHEFHEFGQRYNLLRPPFPIDLWIILYIFIIKDFSLVVAIVVVVVGKMARTKRMSRVEKAQQELAAALAAEGAKSGSSSSKGSKSSVPTPEPKAAASTTVPFVEGRKRLRQKTSEVDTAPKEATESKKVKTEKPDAKVTKENWPKIGWANIRWIMKEYDLTEQEATQVLLATCGPDESGRKFWSKYKADAPAVKEEIDPAKEVYKNKPHEFLDKRTPLTTAVVAEPDDKDPSFNRKKSILLTSFNLSSTPEDFESLVKFKPKGSWHTRRNHKRYVSSNVWTITVH